MFATGTLSAAFAPLATALVVLAFAGVPWTGTLSSLNAAMQLTLPAWVRARGMGGYILVFMGAQAIGSLVWGQVAGAIGDPDALAASAGLLVVVAASVRFLPLLPGTGQFDRTPALDWPTPVLVFEPDPVDGPVLVNRTYRVPEANGEAFATAMAAVSRSRRRTGARRWRLYRDAADPTRFLELFVVPSWGEHLLQHAERWTGADRDWHRAAVALIDGTPLWSTTCSHPTSAEITPATGR